MARILFRFQCVCSECNAPVKLYPADTFPETCPNCKAKFDMKVDSHGHIIPNLDGHTGGLEADKS